MKDRDFLLWLHDRLCQIHGEQHDIYFMGKLRSIISETPSSIETVNMAPPRDSLQWTWDVEFLPTNPH